MQKNIRLLVAFTGLFIINSTVLAQCYELFWADEFNYSGLPNPTIWTHESGGGGFGNNEIQYYTKDDLDNASVENGFLTITAMEESLGGREYTSARLVSRGKFNFQYGKIEARIKTPYGQGIWPAFWMMGENISQVGWPACGEIDILELIGGEGDGRDNTAYGTAHWDNNGSYASYGNNIKLASGIFADTFHIFSLEWTPSTLRCYMDGKQYNALSISSAGLSEFHENFFILLNLAVGGNWPGYPDETTVFPQTLEVDYVRVYKNASEIRELEISGETSFSQKASNKTFSLPYSDGWTYDWSVPDDAEFVSGQDSSVMTVNWGCEEGDVTCQVVGTCDTYLFTKQISTETSIQGPMFVDSNEDDVLFHIDSLGESTMLWTIPNDATIVEGQGTDSLIVQWGETFEAISLSISNSCGDNTYYYEPIKKGQYPYPDINSPHPIPGIIDATEFDYGGQGISFKDLSSGNSGDGPRQDTHVDTDYNDNSSPNVGWISAGEWLEYSIRVDSSSHYDIEARVATDNASGGPFSFWFNDVELLMTPKITDTGGWDTFRTISLGRVYLTPEDTLMKINFDAGGFNMGKLTFTAYAEPNTDTVSVENMHSQIKIFPNPTNSQLNIKSEVPISEYVINDLNGRVLFERKNISETRILYDVSSLPTGMYMVMVKTEMGFSFYEKLLISTNY
ncbi:MAG: family 16 glycosylhydrolase [Bacteroidales bacterium]|nr:family 16 glycosylhydrolase [Bacteroidales bacterium]